jgi:hypothetical protein
MSQSEGTIYHEPYAEDAPEGGNPAGANANHEDSDRASPSAPSHQSLVPGAEIPSPEANDVQHLLPKNSFSVPEQDVQNRRAAMARKPTQPFPNYKPMVCCCCFGALSKTDVW